VVVYFSTAKKHRSHGAFVVYYCSVRLYTKLTSSSPGINVPARITNQAGRASPVLRRCDSQLHRKFEPVECASFFLHTGAALDVTVHYSGTAQRLILGLISSNGRAGGRTDSRRMWTREWSRRET
jgi:hypothetical protein